MCSIAAEKNGKYFACSSVAIFAEYNAERAEIVKNTAPPSHTAAFKAPIKRKNPITTLTLEKSA
jgi:hypothetical protein